MNLVYTDITAGKKINTQCPCSCLHHTTSGKCSKADCYYFILLFVAKNKIKVCAFVVLPDHIHFTWRYLVKMKRTVQSSFAKFAVHGFQKFPGSMKQLPRFFRIHLNYD